LGTRSNHAREIPSLYSLIDGRYPNARSLPSVLAALPNTAEGRKVVQTLLDYFKEKTGYTLPASWVNLALTDSYTLLNTLSVSSAALHEAAIALNLEFDPTNYTSPSTDPVVPSGFRYPDDIAGFNVNMSNYIPSLSPIGADLYLGFFFPNSTTPAQAKVNTVTSFIFNQLSDNLNINSTSPKWFLNYKGQNITSVEGFLNALFAQDSSTSVSTYVTKRIAAFFGLYVRGPQVLNLSLSLIYAYLFIFRESIWR